MSLSSAGSRQLRRGIGRDHHGEVAPRAAYFPMDVPSTRIGGERIADREQQNGAHDDAHEGIDFGSRASFDQYRGTVHFEPLARPVA